MHDGAHREEKRGVVNDLSLTASATTKVVTARTLNKYSVNS